MSLKRKRMLTGFLFALLVFGFGLFISHTNSRIKTLETRVQQLEKKVEPHFELIEGMR